MKGETADEIAAAALVLREQMVRLVPVSGPVLDTCGTGGDDSGTFNISTAAALVACGAGVPVVKHGNRAVSSKSGSADVLRELGVPIECGPEVGAEVSRSRRLRVLLRAALSPRHGPRRGPAPETRRPDDLQPARPAGEPGSAPYQLLGVGKPELLDPLAGALAELGTRQAVLVCSRDGLDEVSLAAPTMVRIVRGREYEAREWKPGGVRPRPGLTRGDQGGRPRRERRDHPRGAQRRRRVPARRIVLANAAAALWAAEAVKTLQEGVEQADAALKSRQAARGAGATHRRRAGGLVHVNK